MQYKCGYCKIDDAKFVEPSLQMKQMFQKVKYKCPNGSKGCEAILKSTGFEYQKHISKYCAFRDTNIIDEDQTKYVCCPDEPYEKDTIHFCADRDAF